MIQDLNAITLTTGDMAGSYAFYVKLGFELNYGGSEAAFTSFKIGERAFLNLQGMPQFRDISPWGRIIIFVEDVDQFYQNVLERGFQTETRPANGSWGERYFHLKDPDGHELSFARKLERTDSSSPSPSRGA